MNHSPFDEIEKSEDYEEYYFDTIEEFESAQCFVLVIYDIADNKRRLRLSKYLMGYGMRVQKSAFEMMISRKKYEKLLRELPGYLSPADSEDSVRLYKIQGRGQMHAWGAENPEADVEEVILI